MACSKTSQSYLSKSLVCIWTIHSFSRVRHWKLTCLTINWKCLTGPFMKWCKGWILKSFHFASAGVLQSIFQVTNFTLSSYTLLPLQTEAAEHRSSYSLLWSAASLQDKATSKKPALIQMKFSKAGSYQVFWYATTSRIRISALLVAILRCGWLEQFTKNKCETGINLPNPPSISPYRSLYTLH